MANDGFLKLSLLFFSKIWAISEYELAHCHIVHGLDQLWQLSWLKRIDIPKRHFLFAGLEKRAQVWLVVDEVFPELSKPSSDPWKKMWISINL